MRESLVRFAAFGAAFSLFMTASAQAQFTDGYGQNAVADAACAALPGTNDPVIRYTDHQSFDCALHRSQEGATPIIVVEIPSGLRIEHLSRAMDGEPYMRLADWLSEIDSRGGVSAICVEPDIQRNQRFLGALLQGILGFLAPWINDVVDDLFVYNHAGNYHAVTVVRPDQESVKRIVFFHRDEAPGGYNRSQVQTADDSGSGDAGRQSGDNRDAFCRYYAEHIQYREPRW